MTCVVDDERRLLGIITDGDLRRHMERPRHPVAEGGDVMTRGAVSIPPATLAAEALNIMEQRKITVDRRRRERLAAGRGRRAPARPLADGDGLETRRTNVDVCPCSPRAAIRLMLFDVDGVLTDGRVIVHADGTESKSFAIPRRHRPGLGAARRAQSGLAVGALLADDAAPRGAAGHHPRPPGGVDKLEAYDGSSTPNI